MTREDATGPPALRCSSARFCYVVLAHRDPDQVLYLVEMLRTLSPGCAVLVRHDRGPDFLAGRGGGVAELRSDIRVTWGGWTMVLAMIEALRHARETTDAQWFVLLSGQDHPLRLLRAWEEEVASAGTDGRVRAEPTDPWPRATLRWRRVDLGALPLSRRTRTLLQRGFYRFINPHQRLVEIWRQPRDLGWALGLPRRGHYPQGLQHHQGSQWMTLSARAVDHLLSSHESRPDVRAWFADTYIPDESYVQTVLFNDPDLRLERMATTHADFSGDDAHPALLTVEAALRARAAGTPFGRKIDMTTNGEVAVVLRQLLADDLDRGAE